MILVLLGGPGLSSLGHSLLGQAREVARGEEHVDQGGHGRLGGAVVHKLGDAEYYCEWNQFTMICSNSVHS